MKFCNFLLRVDGIQEATLEDFKRVVEIGQKIYQPDNQKFLYKVENEIIDFIGCLVNTMTLQLLRIMSLIKILKIWNRIQEHVIRLNRVNSFLIIMILINICCLSMT